MSSSQYPIIGSVEIVRFFAANRESNAFLEGKPSDLCASYATSSVRATASSSEGKRIFAHKQLPADKSPSACSCAGDQRHNVPATAQAQDVALSIVVAEHK